MVLAPQQTEQTAKTAMPVSSSGQVAKSSAFFFSMRITGAGLTYVVQLLLARWIGDEELGRYITGFSWCLVITNFAVMGFPPAALRFVAQARAVDDAATIRGYMQRARQIVFATSVLLAAIVATVMGFARGLDEPGTAVILVGILAVPILASIVLHCGLALSLSWSRLFVLPHGVVRPALFLIAVAATWTLIPAGTELTALTVMSIHVACMVAVLFGQRAIFNRAVRNNVALATPKYDTRAWVGTAWPLMLVGLYGHFFMEYNVIFLGWMLPVEAIGVFGPAHRTAFLIGFALIAVDSATIPRLSRLYRRGELDQLQYEIRGATKLKLAVAIAGLLGLALLGREILSVFGEAFVAGYEPMLILATAMVLRAAIGPAAELLGVTGHQRLSLTYCAIGLIVAPPLDLLLAPSFGLSGAALSILIVMTVTNLLLHREARKRLGVTTSILSIFPRWRS